MSDSLDTLLGSLPKEQGIALIRKWRKHSYPNNQYEAGFNFAREECAADLVNAMELKYKTVTPEYCP